MSRRYTLVTLLVATAFFRLTQNMALTTFSLLGREKLSLSAGMIGGVGALTGLCLSLVTLVFSGRVPPRRAAGSAAAGMVMLLAALLTFSLASSLAMFVLAAVLLGLAGGMTQPGLINAVEANAVANRDRAVGLYAVVLSVSLAIGPLVETLVLSLGHQDVRVPFVVFPIFPMLGAILLGVPCWRRMHPSGPVTVPPAAGATGPRQFPSDERPSRSRPRPRPHRGWRRGLFASRQGRTALIVQLLYAIPFAGLTVFGALVARIGFGVTAAQAQLAFTAFFATSFAARGLVVWRSPVVHKQVLLWASAALTVFGLILLGTGHGLGILLIAMGVLGLPHGLTFPLALALVADSTGPAELPRANAALLGSTNLTTVVVPLVLGAIIPAVGYRGMTLVTLIPVAAFSALLFTQRPRAASLPSDELRGLAPGQE